MKCHIPIMICFYFYEFSYFMQPNGEIQERLSAQYKHTSSKTKLHTEQRNMPHTMENPVLNRILHFFACFRM